MQAYESQIKGIKCCLGRGLRYMSVSILVIQCFEEIPVSLEENLCTIILFNFYKFHVL